MTESHWSWRITLLSPSLQNPKKRVTKTRGIARVPGPRCLWHAPHRQHQHLGCHWELLGHIKVISFLRKLALKCINPENSSTYIHIHIFGRTGLIFDWWTGCVSHTSWLTDRLTRLRLGNFLSWGYLSDAISNEEDPLKPPVEVEARVTCHQNESVSQLATSVMMTMGMTLPYPFPSCLPSDYD